jgi:hypothetical protein
MVIGRWDNERTPLEMIITMKGVQVGVLHLNGVIESQAPELRSLNEYWQTNGIFTMCPAEKTVEGVTVDGAKTVKPSEDINVVIGNLVDRGYDVVPA